MRQLQLNLQVQESVEKVKTNAAERIGRFLIALNKAKRQIELEIEASQKHATSYARGRAEGLRVALKWIVWSIEQL